LRNTDHHRASNVALAVLTLLSALFVLDYSVSLDLVAETMFLNFWKRIKPEVIIRAKCVTVMKCFLGGKVLTFVQIAFWSDGSVVNLSTHGALALTLLSGALDSVFGGCNIWCILLPDVTVVGAKITLNRPE
jgi:hypothetical protein